MISLSISLPQLQMFFLVFLRVGAILMSMPVFESRSIPHVFKLAMAFATSLILFPMLKLSPLPLSNSIIVLGIGVAGEILLGLVIGFSIKLIFAGIQLAGQLAGYQMGLAIANVMDPSQSQQIPLLAQFNNLVALLIFLAINAHFWFIRALTQSFRLVPPLNVHIDGPLMEHLIQLAGNMFVISIKVGAPIIAALLVTTVAFGLVARTVPQMNVFIVAMPLKIGVGLLFLGFSLPYFSAFLKKIFNDLGQHIVIMLKAMS
ncbi:Flagellar biosynthesis protein FliR [Olavius sp. associated proteobacterium Delta 1]|nr:Flagellar biosynthesis protein FliR [Olavius sp. associated proteobacterium Delta 1]